MVRLARISAGTDRGSRNRDSAAAQQLASGAPGPRELELQREVEALRERIHVLERIATDERHSRSIAAEIESLRDRP